ncbi:MAG: branched-chain amino acid ABC transporter permease [Anaerolineales bacterium]
MNNSQNFNWNQAIRMGLIGGGIALSVSAIGMAELFSQRDIIAGVLSLGHLMIFLPPLYAGFATSSKTGDQSWAITLGQGVVVGIFAALPLLALIGLTQLVDLRQFLVNVSPALVQMLTFGQPVANGSLLLLLGFTASSVAASFVGQLPDEQRKLLLTGLTWVLGIGLLSEVLQGRIRDWLGQDVVRLIFRSRSLRIVPAILIFGLALAGSILRKRNRSQVNDWLESMPSARRSQYRWALIALGFVLLLLLPLILGTYLSEVVDNVGIFILMGLGLNIVVGFAGLLDLGYVAFFAIGAYIMAILTSEGSLGLSSGFTFWSALPFAVGGAILAGVILGIPVLRMRGDYLAIVTLGFGEIIRILALSDLLKPLIGGAQGVLQIPKPVITGVSLVRPGQLYYLILAGCLLAAFVSWRLSDSRLGRRWKAMREDEDVAEAMGVRLVTTKLLAFGIGAGFSGLAGAIFASKLTSIFPHSFNLLISINVLSLIIVGGIGSLPGVVVGALVLVGLPELLREFNEYRLLMYGALLIVMMLAKPEGFWPSEVRRRELHTEEEPFGVGTAAAEAGD